MTLRGKLTAQLPLQAGLTCEARLAPAFTASALVSFSLAVSSNIRALLTPFGRLFEIALLFKQGASTFISFDVVRMGAKTVTCLFSLSIFSLLFAPRFVVLILWLINVLKRIFLCSPRALLVCFLVSKLELPLKTNR